MKKIAIVDLLSVVLILVLGTYVFRMQERIARLERVVRGAGDALDSASLLPMPAFALGGKQVTIERGQPRLIFYMSPRCGVCTHNMPIWGSIANQVGRDHTLFVLGDPKEAPLMPAYLAKYGLSGISAVTADSETVNRYYMTTVPKTVLVNADGTVLKVWRGAATAGEVIQGWASIVKQ
jgi:hypothetical protein